MGKEIQNSLVYFGAGVLADRVVQSIFGNSLCDIVDNVLCKLAKKQRLIEKEKRRVVDIMGDTLDGVEYINGEIRKT